MKRSNHENVGCVSHDSLIEVNEIGGNSAAGGLGGSTNSGESLREQR